MPRLKIKSREHRRRRLRRHGRRAYIRSAYSLPSLATLGNAICGFGSMYVAALAEAGGSNDPWRDFFAHHHFVIAAYLIFIAMIFDAVDGRLARFTRHTTDFGGQLDSLADVISFGAAPAFLALQVFRSGMLGDYDPSHLFPPILSRLVWAIGALYLGCAAIRLARFNVSNDHGEQHHFSFLGLPSPGAGGAVAAFILMQQDLLIQARSLGTDHNTVADVFLAMSHVCLLTLPLLVLATGLLMVSHIRYPHLVNRYLRGRRSLGRLVLVMVILLIFVVAHRYAMGIGMLIYVIWGVTGSSYLRLRRRPVMPEPRVPASPGAPKATGGADAPLSTSPRTT
jgi:CDP-diacylglycerol--serine O-phosphatidyltransferase